MSENHDILLIGCGNPLRRDDGVGWRAAQWFEENADKRPIHIITCHQLTPDLAEDLSRVRLVIFVDAREGSRPGRLSCDEVRPLPLESTAFTHDLSPSQLLAYAEILYKKSPKAFLVTIEGEDYRFGESFSEKVASQIPAMIRLIENLLDQSL
ncbi:MAG: hydrogenase maturation protease [Candidatus Omnitrophica bacterium]|nr:hydrogenase maturation protease [Candidatus Omnitrophota bacterium]